MEPIVCTTCGLSISNRFAAYRSMLARGLTPHAALDALRIPTELCCRQIYITTVDLYEFRYGKYNRNEHISKEFQYEPEPESDVAIVPTDGDSSDGSSSDGVSDSSDDDDNDNGKPAARAAKAAKPPAKAAKSPAKPTRK